MFTVRTKDLLEALKKAKVFAGVKSLLPILHGVKITFEDGVCELQTTELETWVKVRIQGWGKSFAGVVGDIKSLEKNLKLFDNETNIELNDSKIKFSSGKKFTNFSSMELEEYPSFPKTDGALNNKYIDNLSDILESWQQVKGSVSTDEARPVLMCCKWDNNKLVSSDGFKISISEVEIPFDLLVPGKVMNVLGWFCGSANIVANKSDDNSFFQFENADITLYYTSYILNNNYPDYNVILPKKYEYNTEINTKELLDALKYFATNYDSGVCKYDGDKKLLSIKTGNDNDLNYELDMGNISIGFNPILMKSIIEDQFKNYDTVILGINKATTPFGFSNPDYKGLSILMPMHLENQGE
jgi:DNA polymerase III subunit beta